MFHLIAIPLTILAFAWQARFDMPAPFSSYEFCTTLTGPLLANRFDGTIGWHSIIFGALALIAVAFMLRRTTSYRDTTLAIALAGIMLVPGVAIAFLTAHYALMIIAASLTIALIAPMRNLPLALALIGLIALPIYFFFGPLIALAHAALLLPLTVTAAQSLSRRAQYRYAVLATLATIIIIALLATLREGAVQMLPFLLIILLLFGAYHIFDAFKRRLFEATLFVTYAALLAVGLFEYAIPLLASIIASAVHAANEREWSLPSARDLFLTAIFAGLVFGAILNMGALTDAPPSAREELEGTIMAFGPIYSYYACTGRIHEQRAEAERILIEGDAIEIVRYARAHNIRTIIIPEDAYFSIVGYDEGIEFAARVDPRITRFEPKNAQEGFRYYQILLIQA